MSLGDWATNAVAGMAIAGVAWIAGYSSGHDSAMGKYETLKTKSEAKVEAMEASNAVLESNYQKVLSDASAVARANAGRLDGLHDRLARACPAARSSGKPDGAGQGGRGGTVAASVDQIAGFAGRCARRADELAAQVTALQDYIRSLR